MLIFSVFITKLLISLLLTLVIDNIFIDRPGLNHTHYNISTTWDEFEGFACIIGSIGESIVYQVSIDVK